MKKQIAIQGIKGCFHEIATKNFFYKKKYNIIKCKTFNELTDFVSTNTPYLGVIAIENSIAGALIYNYNLIRKKIIKISGEIYLYINHNLMILKKNNIKNIKKIISHPMALLQCKNYLSKYPKIKISEYRDTAEAAFFIFKKKKKNIAAIASKEAAFIYNLKIIDKNIQTVNKNFTRFLILKNNFNYKKNKIFNKVSFFFKLKNNIGEFYKLIKVIFNLNINITNIHTFPRKKKPWEYIFYIDITFNVINNYLLMKKKINKINNFYYILGEYKNSIKI